MSGSASQEAFFDPDASREYLRSWQEQVTQRTARTLAMSEQLQQLRVTGKDGNGMAEVTVDSSGVMLDLQLTDRIHRYAPDVVARAVMTALREARTVTATRAQEIAVQVMGPDSLSARTIAERMQQQLTRPEVLGDVPDEGR